jgi:hypothetical protein
MEVAVFLPVRHISPIAVSSRNIFDPGEAQCIVAALRIYALDLSGFSLAFYAQL